MSSDLPMNFQVVSTPPRLWIVLQLTLWYLDLFRPLLPCFCINTRMDTAASRGHSSSHFFRSHHTSSLTEYIILYSHCQCTRVTVSQSSPMVLFVSLYFCNYHFTRHTVVFICISWWLVTLNSFPYVCWPFLCHLEEICIQLWLIFQSGNKLFMYFWNLLLTWYMVC